MGTTWLGVQLWLVHMLVTKIGLTLVESQILHAGNQQLLNSLDQGLIIFDSISREQLFVNKAVSERQMDVESFNSLSIQEGQAVYNKIVSEDKIFAKLDLKLFKSASVNAAEICEHISSLSDFKNLKEIVSEQEKQGFKAGQLIYKLCRMSRL